MGVTVRERATGRGSRCSTTDARVSVRYHPHAGVGGRGRWCTGLYVCLVEGVRWWL
jgi:hypothetical protein